jgi:hypothetical protein
MRIGADGYDTPANQPNGGGQIATPGVTQKTHCLFHHLCEEVW